MEFAPDVVITETEDKEQKDEDAEDDAEIDAN